MEKEDGGAAFPRMQVGQGNTYNTQAEAGMSLRDYFAVHASEKDITSRLPPTLKARKEYEAKHGYVPTREWARYAYADDMIRERFK